MENYKTTVVITRQTTGESRLFLLNSGELDLDLCMKMFRRYNVDGTEREIVLPEPAIADEPYHTQIMPIQIMNPGADSEDMDVGIDPEALGWRNPLPSQEEAESSNNLFRSFSANMLGEMVSKVISNTEPDHPDSFDLEAAVRVKLAKENRKFEIYRIGGAEEESERNLELSIREI